MSLLQYKPEHYGKKFHKSVFPGDWSANPSNWSVWQNQEPTELTDGTSYIHIMIKSSEDNHGGPWSNVNGWLNSAPGRFRSDIRYGDHKKSKKFILLKLEEKTIKSKLFSEYQVTFYKVQTQDPYSDEDRFMQFWVNKEWIEPLTKTDYVSDLKKKLLKELLEEK